MGKTREPDSLVQQPLWGLRQARVFTLVNTPGWGFQETFRCKEASSLLEF